ncbi:MAG: LysE family translocator [Sneathiella sp.]|nr:LysE family translocator [Sneathiella sp.]
MEVIFLIALFALTMTGSPGPANMILMASGARYGYRKSVFLLLGTMTGFLVVGISVAAGLGALFSLFPALRYTFLGLSAAYMLYLAYKIAFSDPSLAGSKARIGYKSGLLVHILNPKAWAMLIAAYSQFSAPGWTSLQQFMVLQVIFGIVGFSSNSLWILAGDALNRFVQNTDTLRAINKGLAVLMLAVVTYSVIQSGLIDKL